MEVFTQWESDDRYTELSNMWRDTVLVCRKALLYKVWCLAIQDVAWFA